jgi:hypothetical protein
MQKPARMQKASWHSQLGLHIACCQLYAWGYSLMQDASDGPALHAIYCHQLQIKVQWHVTPVLCQAVQLFINY